MTTTATRPTPTTKTVSVAVHPSGECFVVTRIDGFYDAGNGFRDRSFWEVVFTLKRAGGDVLHKVPNRHYRPCECG